MLICSFFAILLVEKKPEKNTKKKEGETKKKEGKTGNLEKNGGRICYEALLLF